MAISGSGRSRLRVAQPVTAQSDAQPSVPLTLAPSTQQRRRWLAAAARAETDFNRWAAAVLDAAADHGAEDAP